MIELSDILAEANRLLFHPLGKDLSYTGSGNELLVTEISVGGRFIAPSSRVAAAVAEAIEERGVARMAELGYVIQSLPMDVKQLTLRVLQPSRVTLGQYGEDDEGEEHPCGVVVDGELLP